VSVGVGVGIVFGEAGLVDLGSWREGQSKLGVSLNVCILKSGLAKLQEGQGDTFNGEVRSN